MSTVIIKYLLGRLIIGPIKDSIARSKVVDIDIYHLGPEGRYCTTAVCQPNSKKLFDDMVPTSAGPDRIYSRIYCYSE
jgi:hypothetical protein